MAVLLVRHAEAGDRDTWDGPDDLRPLTAEGDVQARGLIATLAGFDVTRVLSSPYLRCSQTVAPLAAARGLAVEPCEDLAEGQGPAGLALARRLLGAPRYTVLCTHGDVVEEVLDGLGVDREDDTAKGATWALDEAGAQHLPSSVLTRPPPGVAGNNAHSEKSGLNRSSPQGAGSKDSQLRDRPRLGRIPSELDASVHPVPRASFRSPLL